ncbi:MAG: SDR family oxidoreductase [Melioribacteraceae bacterium]|nr:SDR family oxidoreductase [Melioribacteraceae bacterium]MCF8353803.1 SDR family oxidoreductase [Melioribacteraceae bacterium]MCF8393639.1 SDR family oxidoreductase [Melioribacteraceae bacterium]MCF8419449.1 SDR family oxidoreductase [Melioribacteraceae bacterium]
MNYKTAIITGAGRGIGRHISIALADDGYKTILIGKTNKHLDITGKKIMDIVFDKPELTPEVYEADITDHNQTEKIFNEIILKNSRIDVLVNNAGIWMDGSLENSLEDFRKVIETNLTAQFSVLQKVVPLMKKQKSGYIFNIASRSGIYGYAGSGTYSSSKFGMVGLSESLYRELAEYNIKVTAVCPSFVNTDMAQEVGATIPTDEMIQPKDISNSIRYLLDLSTAASIKEIVIECRLRIK